MNILQSHVWVFILKDKEYKQLISIQVRSSLLLNDLWVMKHLWEQKNTYSREKRTSGREREEEWITHNILGRNQGAVNRGNRPLLEFAGLLPVGYGRPIADCMLDSSFPWELPQKVRAPVFLAVAQAEGHTRPQAPGPGLQGCFVARGGFTPL